MAKMQRVDSCRDWISLQSEDGSSLKDTGTEYSVVNIYISDHVQTIPSLPTDEINLKLAPRFSFFTPSIAVLHFIWKKNTATIVFSPILFVPVVIEVK
jgi:hypothetical protein